ncbi:hypothetical protein A4U61_20085 [Streptomyces sp. H-KF8]|nr:hypothetical protein A4U61_20085 [Streptomyces sp. H-KF8]
MTVTGPAIAPRAVRDSGPPALPRPCHRPSDAAEAPRTAAVTAGGPADRNTVPGDQFVKALNLSGPAAV